MNRRTECGITEEAIIDALLKQKTGEERESLLRHAANCVACRERIREWSGLLQQTNGGQGMLAPSQPVWRRLRRSVWWSALVRRWTRKSSSGPKRSGLLVCSAAALLAGGLYFGAMSDVADRLRILPSNFLLARADQELTREISVMASRLPLQVPVNPVGMGPARGIALIDVDGEEILLLFEGLQDDPESVYRVWSVHGQSVVNLGTMRQTQGRAHLHYQGSEIHVAKMISVRREPRGSTPSAEAPEVANLQLKPR
jgi:hypothetical protein